MPVTSSPASASALEIDNTKAAALPVLMIIALLLAGCFTRHTLAAAYTNAKEDFRKLIIFGGGIICAILSVFLLPTSAWAYGAASALFAYMSTLMCQPGVLDDAKQAETAFMVYLGWFLTLIGVPDLWSDGVIAATANCEKWFPAKTSMCDEGWLTYVVILAIAIIILNFFVVIALMSMVFACDVNAYAAIPSQGAACPGIVTPSAESGAPYRSE